MVGNIRIIRQLKRLLHGLAVDSGIIIDQPLKTKQGKEMILYPKRKRAMAAMR